MRRGPATALRGLAMAIVATLTLAAPAMAEDGSIAHVEAGEAGLQVLVNVPPGVQVDLDGVTATLDGTSLKATASKTDDGAQVRRTTMLAIDTSRSMARKNRFNAAKKAAATYLETVPDDVEVGIVSFDSDVTVALEPTTDRAQALTVLNGLDLALKTMLYDGVKAAVDTAGDAGQRTVLVLSDGADTGSATSLTELTQLVGDTNTLLDVVSLGLKSRALTPLRAMAKAGAGRVIAT
ncbi:MAG: VWA domain-containing protein, partial [Nocardioidaceae bacterium]|nr:VWA domain-containing protein [Nocardioidaceae bacterium]